MRILLALVILVALAAAGSPIAGGLLTERAFASFAQQNPRLAIPMLGSTLELSPDAYQAGLLRSELRTPVGPARLGRTVLDHEIFHGPFVYGQLGRGLVASVIETRFGTERQGEVSPLPIRMVTVVEFDQSVHVELNGEPIDQEGLALEGVSGTLDVSDEGARVRALLDLGGIELESATVSLSLGQTTIDIDTRPSERGVPIGQLRATLERASLRDAQGRDIQIRDLRGEQNSVLDDEAGTITASSTLRVGELTVDALEYRDIDLDLSFRNFDEEAVANLRSEQGNGLPPTRRLLAQASALLQKGPEIEIETGRMQTPNGLLETHLKIQGRPEMADMPLDNPLTALSVVNVDLDLDMSPTHFGRVTLAAAQQQAKLAGFDANDPRFEPSVRLLEQRILDDGYVEVEGSGDLARYRTRIQLEGGAASINGRPINILDILMANRTASN